MDEEFKLEDILGLEGDLVTQIAVDPDQQGSTADAPGSYTAEMHKMQNASNEFLEVMKELFATELETLIAKNEEQQKNDPEKQEELIQLAELALKKKEEVVIMRAGLLGFGGGGGGGGLLIMEAVPEGYFQGSVLMDMLVAHPFSGY